ncbi:protein of unknown function [Taphrina deformans PYCC 5710]|uniref:Uncharacterized protein n=1 Tax=Taphrina deformans (strain PYCC 5710 / ATCC 11124 / CBS 356.35 / IMI 108563 / JCM 9778 / NBRC 8474) TaxID=1097556 RepID=R4XMT4_TAPDE|nr:protein of unknown function [Taphrina deformans PYCC 5710]|eukprot:CCG84609.1 protein of unknown function [Taphrina deformans PYCC 5710]
MSPKSAFIPEKKRTEAFVALANSVTEPETLKERSQKASSALQSYQKILTAMDAKLSEPLTSEEKTQLEKAQDETNDVALTLKEIAKVTKDPAHTANAVMDSAYTAFMDARKAEIEAGHAVETACPQDID